MSIQKHGGNDLRQRRNEHMISAIRHLRNKCILDILVSTEFVSCNWNGNE